MKYGSQIRFRGRITKRGYTSYAITIPKPLFDSFELENFQNFQVILTPIQKAGKTAP